MFLFEVRVATGTLPRKILMEECKCEGTECEEENINLTFPSISQPSHFPDVSSTKNMNKSARNRFYAQTSRARHRAYVASLEKDRELLVKRLEMIEEENRKMKEELMELKQVKRVKSQDPPALGAFVDPQYALSVLDLSLQDSLPMNQPTLVTSSPWQISNEKFTISLLLFLVCVTEGFGRRDPMNWRGNYCEPKRMCRIRRQDRMEICTLTKCLKAKKNARKVSSPNLLLLKLRELKVFFQQFGEI